MKKILVVLPCITKANGVSSYALNYFKKMDINKIHMDFIVVKESDKECYKNFEKNGTIIYELIKGKSSICNYIKRIDEFFRINASNYDIIHCHTYNSGAFILNAAKKYGISTRILHSHATKSSDKFTHRIINFFLIPISKWNATHYFACSNLAGKFLFKNKKFTIINNAVDIEKYKFDYQKRIQIRRELQIENDFVIGNIGRLCNQKNQIFLLKVFYELTKEKSDIKLIIIGNGDLEDKLIKYVKEKKIEDKVIFFGAVSNVDEIYNGMDLFCLTSLYEGLPVVGVEAQCNGLPCVFSDSITKELKINGNVIFLKLNKNVKFWKRNIMENIDRISCNFEGNHFDIDNEAKALEEKYLHM